MGWMGIFSHVQSVANVYGIDRDENDVPITSVEDEHGLSIPGPCVGVSVFMGEADENGQVIVTSQSEVVIADNVIAYKDKKRAGTLAGLMNSTSYGVRNITVI